jgi:Subtilisin inhibitor-like
MAMTPIPDEVRSHSKHRAVLARSAAIGACALLAAACGSTAAPGSGAASTGSHGTSGSGTGAGSASTAASAKISLDVTFEASLNKPATHYTLRCEPAGGTAHHAAAACARLLSGTSLFAARPGHVMCPMIMASAGRALVEGTYLGKKVHVTIVDGGCDLARWAKLKAVFN